MMTWMEQAKNWALSQLPNEACGVLIIEKGREVFIPCKNISDLPEDSFAINPIDFANAEDRGDIIKIIHSHCYSSPRPSEPDKVSCESSGLPWSIVSVPNGDWFHFEPAGYKAPLVGRSWAHGTLDCYSLIRDYYREILKINLPDFERRHEWWMKGDNLYLDNFEKAGFHEVPASEMRVHDVALMQIQSPVINHGAVIQEDDRILHHIHKRLSSRETFGGYYKKHTVKIMRHHAND